MLESWFSADAWRSIETSAKVIGLVLAGSSAVSGAVAFVANQNAAARAKEPRELAGVQVNDTAPKTEPFSLVIISHSSPEAQSYADKIAGAMPQGSRVGRINIATVSGPQMPNDSVSYNANGQEVGGFLLWLHEHNIKASRINYIPAPGSAMANYKNYIVLVVGPQKNS